MWPLRVQVLRLPSRTRAAKNRRRRLRTADPSRDYRVAVRYVSRTAGTTGKEAPIGERDRALPSMARTVITRDYHMSPPERGLTG